MELPLIRYESLNFYRDADDPFEGPLVTITASVVVCDHTYGKRYNTSESSASHSRRSARHSRPSPGSIRMST